ncbi:MAG TPA: fumarylacetoacetate hydrolase family protein [bacterium]|nr:fumarylacetoacetate hydrolase family protein [bacterium]
MKLLNCQIDNERFIGLLDNNRTINLSKALKVYSTIYRGEDWFFNSIEDLLSLDNPEFCLKKVADFIERYNLKESLYVESFKTLSPIIRPSKIIALGRNYTEHARETGYNPPEEPIFFSKAVSAIIGPEDAIVYPEWLTRVDPEAELGLVIGKRAKNVSKEKAMEYILGYTIINDVTARDMQTEDLKMANPWFRSKSFDTFCPIGPYLVLKGYIRDPHDLNIELRVNGTTRQKDNTRNLIFKIPEIVSYITLHMTLEPGDIIATGTPSGIAPVYPGDTVEVEIENIGILRNTVIRG